MQTSNTIQNNEILANHPISEFGTLNKGENIVVTGESASGKTVFSFDMIAALLNNDKKVLIVSDEYSAETVLVKTAFGLQKIKGADEPYSTIFREMPRHNLIVTTGDVFADYEKFETFVKEGNFDAIVVDMVTFKSMNPKEVVKNHLDMLKSLSEKFGVFTSYGVQNRAVDVMDKGYLFDRAFHTERVNKKSKVIELNTDWSPTGKEGSLKFI